jgi:hypothetical protein
MLDSIYSLGVLVWVEDVVLINTHTNRANDPWDISAVALTQYCYEVDRLRVKFLTGKYKGEYDKIVISRSQLTLLSDEEAALILLGNTDG